MKYSNICYQFYYRRRICKCDQSETNLVFMNITVTALVFAYHCVHYGNVIAKSEDANKFDILMYKQVLIELLAFIVWQICEKLEIN